MRNFAKILPSRRFSAVLGSLVFVIALVWGAKALSMSNNPSVSIADSPSLIASSEIERLSFEKANSLDDDNDGLKNWEEILWQTDPQNPDTDGDGTKDGEEIEKNRNPKIKGPNDTLNLPTDSTNNLTTNNTEKLTATDLVARDFFSKYVQAKQGGQPLTEDLEQQIASSVLLQTKTAPTFRIYGEGDLIIDKNDTVENLKTYGELMGKIIQTSPTWKGNELDIIYTSLEREDADHLKNLTPIIVSYTFMKEEALKIKVPQKAISVHIDFLNSIEKIIYSLKSAQNVFTDPVTTLGTFGKYPEIITEFHKSFINARALFQRNNIAYKTSESGYYFANFADLIDLKSKEQ